jgi:hypothetical protein
VLSGSWGVQHLESVGLDLLGAGQELGGREVESGSEASEAGIAGIALGLPAMNIGVAKGSTFDRVLIFPTKPMKQYLADGEPTKLRAPERLYVAVTRARHSAAFMV